MGSLLDDHEEHLATSLEDPENWGVEATIKSPGPAFAHTYVVNGQSNIVSLRRYAGADISMVV